MVLGLSVWIKPKAGLFLFVSVQTNVSVATPTSASQVQIRRFSQTDNQAEVITVPVTGSNGTG